MPVLRNRESWAAFVCYACLADVDIAVARCGELSLGVLGVLQVLACCGNLSERLKTPDAPTVRIPRFRGSRVSSHVGIRGLGRGPRRADRHRLGSRRSSQGRIGNRHAAELSTG
ncbi:3-phosphoinositide-dependent protein kinase 1 [Alternaria alternata]|nr:3-phosphoinositide-dependent protein kinase 1 [Alternaria alternata]